MPDYPPPPPIHLAGDDWIQTADLFDFIRRAILATFDQSVSHLLKYHTYLLPFFSITLASITKLTNGLSVSLHLSPLSVGTKLSEWHWYSACPVEGESTSWVVSSRCTAFTYFAGTHRCEMMIVLPTSIQRYYLNETDHSAAIHVRAFLFAWMLGLLF